MNTDSYSFIILVMILGMGVVFFFLGMLSCIIVLLKKLAGSDSASAPSPNEESAAPAAVHTKGRSAPPHGVLLSAASAFLREEQELQHSNISSWTPAPLTERWVHAHTYKKSKGETKKTV